MENAAEETIEEFRKKMKVEVKDILIGKGKDQPWIIIDKPENVLGYRIVFNRRKLYRVLKNKNGIQKTLDIAIVDKICEVLDKLAKREEAVEEKLKDKEDSNEIQRDRPASGGNTGHGQGGSKGTDPGQGET